VLVRQRQKIQEVPRVGQLKSRKLIWPAAAAAALFILLGTLLIPRSGLDADEALFAGPLYRSLGADFEIHVLHHGIPVMVLWYIGTLKTAFCWPALHFLPPSLYALRLPAVLAGAATILLFFFFAESVAGGVAAACAAVLLATDPTFLLTDTFDWGPVALEHLLLIGGCLAMVRRHAALGAFLFGLALWNKATFVWALAGLVAAALIAYWPTVLSEARRFLADRRLLLRCATALLIGALPLILFNLHRRAATLNASQGISIQDFGAKVHQLRGALDGSGLFGYVAAEDGNTAHPRPTNPIFGRGFRSSLFPYAFVLAILAAPWWPARRAGVFALAFCAVTFLVIAITRGAGTGIHHSVLLWPMPQLLVGIACSALRPRWAALAIAVLAISNLLVMDRYFFQLDRNGADGNFTDAIASLSARLASAPNEAIYIVDWGIYEPLVYLEQGRVPLHYSPGLLAAERPSAAQARSIDGMFADPRGLFVTHVAAREMFHGTRARLENFAAALGLHKRVIEVIPDSNGRPVFELWRFSAAP
jgi:hypothetical protein